MSKQLQIAGEKIFPVEAAEQAAKLAVTPEVVLRSMGRLEYTVGIDAKTVQESIEFAARQGYIRASFEAGDILDLRFSQ
jgi:hypothetical protein